MSTKWNNAQKLQKTPAVCKAGPDPLDPTLRIFRYYPLQAQADWTQGTTPLEASITGTTLLAAHPDTFSHSGQIFGDRARLDLLLEWFEVGQVFLFTLSLYVEDAFADQVDIQFSTPTNVLPFSAGLFTWARPGDQLLAHAKIFS